MSIAEQQQEDRQVGANLPREGPVTPWHLESDPFANAHPVSDLAVLTGGLPDARDADEILRDLAHCRVKRARR